MIRDLLRRHPFPIQAHFRYSLVLTFAYPEAVLRPLLPYGLELDTYQGNGFLAIALVRTEGLRPRGWPAWTGRDFFLSGYRIFSRFRAPDGRELRGLRILRSDADKWGMVRAGNLMTRYGYRKCEVRESRTGGELALEVETPGGEADLRLRAWTDRAADAPPDGSPFPDLAAAARFAGPLPHTFGYEERTRSMIVVKGIRQQWRPKPIRVGLEKCAWLEHAPFAASPRILANAFWLENIPYRWERGVAMPIRGPG
jgi:hypothetical protein